MSIIRYFSKRNVGPLDRVLRAVPALAVAMLWLQGLINDGFAIALAVPSAMLLATAVTGVCSIYHLLGLSTRSADASRDGGP
ncbi:MAG: DUF2892 domain-containing protein [Pseudomonadota bacterium]